MRKKREADVADGCVKRDEASQTAVLKWLPTGVTITRLGMKELLESWIYLHVSNYSKGIGYPKIKIICHHSLSWSYSKRVWFIFLHETKISYFAECLSCSTSNLSEWSGHKKDNKSTIKIAHNYTNVHKLFVENTQKQDHLHKMRVMRHHVWMWPSTNEIGTLKWWIDTFISTCYSHKPIIWL